MKAEKEGKDIVIAVASNFTGMDPHDTNDTLSESAQKTMLEGLVGFDKDMNVIPVLAKVYVRRMIKRLNSHSNYVKMSYFMMELLSMQKP